ncbi:MAG: hypothetical protein HY900_21155 [Deltaproteobacteria bacterium]|nr:hypothetical protein [Deltaproteobacteria bacterium]
MKTPPAPPRPLPRRKKRGGCCSCCLFLVLAPVILLFVLFLASWAWPRLRSDPVEKEWKSIPDYYSGAAHPDGGGRGA